MKSAIVVQCGWVHHVLAAGLLDLTAGEDPTRIGAHHDLQQNTRIKGRGAGVVVAVHVIEHREVNVVVNEMV
jgi:hypothetical protein